MFKSIVSSFHSRLLNSLIQPQRRRLQSQTPTCGDSLEVRLLLTGPQLVDPISNNGCILTDVVSDHGGALTVNVDVDSDGIFEYSEEAVEGVPLLIDLTAFIPANTTQQDVFLQIVEEPLVNAEDLIEGPEMSSSVTLDVAGIEVLATEFEWIEGADSILGGAVDLTNALGTVEVLYRVAGETEWGGSLGEVSGYDGSFLFTFDLADGETDFEFVVQHSYMDAVVLSSSETIFDMTGYVPGLPGEEPAATEPAATDPAIAALELDELFADGYVY